MWGKQNKNLVLNISLFIIYLIAIKLENLLKLENLEFPIIYLTSGIIFSFVSIFERKFITILILVLIASNVNIGEDYIFNLINQLAVIIQAFIMSCLVKKIMKRTFISPKIKENINFILIIFTVTFLISVAITIINYLIKDLTLIKTFNSIFLGNILGILLLSPIIYSHLVLKENKFELKNKLKVIIIYVVLVITCILVYSNIFPQAVIHSMDYIFIVFILISSFKYDLRKSFNMVLIISLLSIIGTANKTGPFYQNNREHSFLLLQVFLIILSIISLLLSKLIEEGKKNYYYLMKNEKKYRNYFELGLIGIVISSEKKEIKYTNDFFVIC